MTDRQEMGQLFDSLVVPNAPAGSQVFAAAPVPGRPSYRIAKDPSGAPTLLVEFDESAEAPPAAPIRLEHLYVAHNVECDIHKPDGAVETSRFLVVRCVDADSALVSYFLVVIEALLASLGPTPTPLAVSSAVGRLAELFRSMQGAPRKTAQGLWAELLVILTSARPEMLLDAWHAGPNDLYDFSSEGQRLEVKSALGQVRTHHFSLDQLNVREGVSLVVCSVLMNRVARGATISDLVGEILQRLSRYPDRMMHLHSVVTATLGTNWRQAVVEAFDLSHAKANIRFYQPTAIPAVHAEVPQGVSDVRFRSDLSGISPLGQSELRALGGLFGLLKAGNRG